MAEIKDKIVTVESLSSLHDYNKEIYMTQNKPTGTGTVSMNRKQDTTVGTNSVAMGGMNVEASGFASYAEGQVTVASGIVAHAEGYGTVASGKHSHSEGTNTKAKGEDSHAEGRTTESTGYASHTEGNLTIASGNHAHAEGQGAIASGITSHAEGERTIAASLNQHVQGRYNIEDAEDKYAHIVGNGNLKNDKITRSNAHTLDWDGNAWFAGLIEANHIILKSSTEGSEKRFKVTVDDSGVLTATEIIEVVEN